MNTHRYAPINHKCFNIVDRFGTIHSRTRIPSHTWLRAFTTSTDGTDIMEIWINPAHAPKELPYTLAGDGDISSLITEKQMPVYVSEVTLPLPNKNMTSLNKTALKYKWLPSQTIKIEPPKYLHPSY